MGHLHEICKKIRDYGTKVPEIQQILDSTDNWKAIVLAGVDETQKVYSEELGGSTKGVSTVRLNSVAQLESDQGSSFNSRSEVEVEFGFDTLDDEDDFFPESSFVTPSNR